MPLVVASWHVSQTALFRVQTNEISDPEESGRLTIDERILELGENMSVSLFQVL